MESLQRSLELGIVSQKEENNNFQDQLTELKKEKSILSQMISLAEKDRAVARGGRSLLIGSIYNAYSMHQHDINQLAMGLLM